MFVYTLDDIIDMICIAFLIIGSLGFAAIALYERIKEKRNKKK